MLNIVIPMAGLGSRLKNKGHALPKPMIELWPGKRMIQMVLDYLRPGEPHRFILVCQKKHKQGLRLDAFFRLTKKKFKMATSEGLTEGPACTALLAKKWINNHEELLIAYCDDYLDIKLKDLLRRYRKQKADGGLMLYPSKSINNSYAKVRKNGKVLRTAEKNALAPGPQPVFIISGKAVIL